MKNVTRIFFNSCPASPVMLLLCSAGILSACGGGSGSDEDTADFQIHSAQQNLILIEGDQDGLRIPLTLTRSNGHEKTVTLSARGATEADVAFVTSSFSDLELSIGEDQSEAVLKLSINNSPIQPQEREFFITANDGTDLAAISLSVMVQPTSAPDVYLLAGQSNMVGFSGDATRQAEPGGLDEPNQRIKQLNATKNDSAVVFQSPDDYTSPDANVIASEKIVTALDPLHIPQDPENNNNKDVEYIGLGLSFAKAALADTSADIVLVPAAWSGSSFCQNSEGPDGGWLPQPSDNPNLSNTLLFERAVIRANLALDETGGVFRGILWHQGESDANERCSGLYEENMKLLIEQFRSSIKPTGNEALRRIETIYPFILGTMSRGADEREDLSVFLDTKQAIDDIHRNLPNIVEATAVTINDDLTPAEGYDCGQTTCIHFGPTALREMGKRYYRAMSELITP